MQINSEEIIPVPTNFKAHANLNLENYQNLEASFKQDYLGTWARLAKEELFWHKDFLQTLDDSEKPFYKWFADGETNISYNCLDVHLKDRGDKIALIFEDEAGESEFISYKALHARVCEFTAYLKNLGVKKGDRVCIYMSLCPEAIIAMHACTRIGAIHSVVFAGFAAHALKNRIDELSAKVLITQNGFYRRGKIVELLEVATEAINENSPVEDLLIFKRIKRPLSLPNSLKPQIHDVEKDLPDFLNSVPSQSEVLSSQQDLSFSTPEWLSGHDTSFILYTSGSTGKPKGIEHCTAGYLLWTKLTSKWVFDIKDDDIYWCTADIGWITGHSYVAYGPLANGATVFVYEGAPNFPEADRYWALIEKYKINIFYTAPTAIRSFQAWGLEHVEKHDLSSLRLLGSVGEPIGSETWKWFYKNIGKSKCPIVDTWWQTETGGIMISTLPSVNYMRPGTAGPALVGISAEINPEGLLHISKPWPSMLKGVYKNPDRYIKGYWTKIPDSYLPGDLADISTDAYIKIGGRNDDVINVSGHRLGTAEIETALAKHQIINESAVIAIPHEIKGEGIIAFVVLKQGLMNAVEDMDYQQSHGSIEERERILKEHIANEIGVHAKPERIIICEALPKTRSGKVMRRLLKDIAQDRLPDGDLSTLEDKDVVEKLLMVVKLK
jgi:acetyl-CoA synthetase